MKKLVKLTAVGLSCALAFSLAACGGDDDGNNPADNAPNPNDVKTEQVTEAEWAAAFDFSDVTKVTFKTAEKYSAMGMTDEYYDIVKFDGNKIYTESYNYDENYPEDGGRPPKVTIKTYYSVSADAAYIYKYDNSAQKWGKEETEWYPTVNNYSSQGGDFSDYSSFTYNASKNAYVSNAGTFDGDSVSVKITGGKVSVVQVDSSFTEGGMTAKGQWTFQAYDIGTTSVALPKIDGEEEEEEEGDSGKPAGGSEVTEAQWNAALSASAFRNVTVTNTMKMDGGTTSQIMKYDYSNKCVLIENETYTYINVYVGDEGGYRLVLNDGEWEYERSISSTFENELRSITSITGVFGYRAFTYADGVYSVKNYNVEEMGDTVADVNMKFDSGRLIRCEIEMTTAQGQKRTAIMVFANYGTTSVEMPQIEKPNEEGNDGPSDGEWNDALNGVYYRYYDGEYDYKTLLEIHDGMIKTSFGESAKVEINGTDIRVTVEMTDEEYGYITKVFEGTIKDGVINFTYLATYDEKGMLISEQKGSIECYRKDKE